MSTLNPAVSEIVRNRFGIDAQPGGKTKCPFCNHKTLSIKRDDTLAKCFHPTCGRFITGSSPEGSQITELHGILESIFLDWHSELSRLSKQSGRNAYAYLIDERRIHPQVVSDSMLGAVPGKYDANAHFAKSLDDMGSGVDTARKEVNEKKLEALKEAENRLLSCLKGTAGWLAFFHTDAYHRIVSIRFRKPYAKDVYFFKPHADVNGVFGHGLFHPNQSHESLAKDLPLLVTEGEFNQLQLQSLCVRINDASGQEPEYVNACAVGGVDNTDYETIARVSKKPVFCHDNDENQAGFALVTKARRTMHVTAFTTPEIESDLDSFIRSFGDRHQGAWAALQELVSSRKQYEKRFDSIRQEVKDLRYEKKKVFHLNTDVANAIVGDLSERGRFYNDGFRSYVFLNARKELIPVDRDETRFALLLDEYGINRADTLFKWIFEALGVEGMKTGEKVDIRRFAYYDKRAHIVYVTNFANQMYRITPEIIDLVDNGTDGVLFLTDPLAEPYEICDRECSESLLDKHLISRINLSSDRLSPDQRRLLLLLWIMSVFFESVMPTKSILAFIGERGSGKSTACRLLGKILFGSKFDVIPMPAKEDDFDTAATNATYLVVDNADTRKNWFLDKLAVAATGGSTQKRQLYTDNRIVRLPLKCYISVTSREPRFRRDDIASRLLLMKVDRLGDQIVSESDLRDEILSIRNQVMTEILYFVQDALKGLRENSKLKVTSSFRMADFASFAIRIAEFGGIRDEIETILRLTEGEQSDFTIEDDPIVDLLKDWAKENITEEITATQLCVELAKIAEDKNIGFYYKGKERAFAQKFRHLVSDLGEQFEIAHRMVHGGRKLYMIKLKIEAA